MPVLGPGPLILAVAAGTMCLPRAGGVHLGPAPTRPQRLLVEETAWRVPPPLHVKDNSRSPGD